MDTVGHHDYKGPQQASKLALKFPNQSLSIKPIDFDFNDEIKGKTGNQKMQIQIKCNCNEETCPEWAIVEIQGVVEAQPSFQDRLQNLEIGQLCRPSLENYTFTVGYHELTGSKVPLKKPTLVLKKKKIVNVEEQSSESDSDAPGVELEVVGIIRHRILFKNRPKALISKPQPIVKERATATGSSAPIK